MRTRHALFSAALLTFVLVGSPRQTFAEDGVEIFEPDLRHLRYNPKLIELLKRARQEVREGDLKTAREDFERAYTFEHGATAAGELGLLELRLGEYVDAAQHLDQAAMGVDAPWSHDEYDLIHTKLEEARNHVGLLNVTTNAEDAVVSVDGKIYVPRGFPWRFFVSPGKHKISVTAKHYWPESSNIVIKEGEAKDVWIGMQERATQTTIQYPAGENANVPADRLGAERPEWAKTLMVTSVVTLGISVGVGIVGFIVERQAVDDVTMKHAGVGMEVAGAIGLGFSVIGIGVGLVSTPPGPTIVYNQGSNHKPTESSTLVVTPHVGPRMVGLGVRGVF